MDLGRARARRRCRRGDAARRPRAAAATTGRATSRQPRIAFGDEIERHRRCQRRRQRPQVQRQRDRLGDRSDARLPVNPIWVQSVATLVRPGLSASATTAPRRSSRRPAGSAPPPARVPPTWPGRSMPSRPKRPLRRRRSGDRPDRPERRPRAVCSNFPAPSEAQLIAKVEAAGARLGRQVNRIANAGAKVLLSTDPRPRPHAVRDRRARRARRHRPGGAADAPHRDASTRRCARRSSTTAARSAWSCSTSSSRRSRKTRGGGFTNDVDPVCDLTKSSLRPPSILDCTTLTLVPGGNSRLSLGRRPAPQRQRADILGSARDHARAEQPVLTPASGEPIGAGRRERRARRSPPIRPALRARAAPRSRSGG